jgi:hypothetical protein
VFEARACARDLFLEAFVLVAQVRHALAQLDILVAQSLAQFSGLSHLVFERGKFRFHRHTIVAKISPGQAARYRFQCSSVIADTTPGAAPDDFAGANPLRPDAVRLAGTTRRGKACELIDNTGRGLPRDELAALLEALIEQDRFGFALASAKGGTTLALDRHEAAHVQIDGGLYRLLVHRHTARLEPF